MARFFAFGCSFTQYHWPTWADIIRQDYQPLENWGRSAAGNQFIFNAVVECNLRRKFTPDDTVIIMWSSFLREDRYINGKWANLGNLFVNKDYKKLAKEASSLRGGYIRDLALIYSTQKLLESTGCRWYFTSIMDVGTNFDFVEIEKDDVNNNINDLLEHYHDTIKLFRPSVHQVLFNYDWASRPKVIDYKLKEEKRQHYENCAGPDWPSFDDMLENRFIDIPENIVKEIKDPALFDWNIVRQNILRQDLHPTPLEHLEYITRVFPDIPISPQTRQWVSDVEDAIIKDPRTFEKHLKMHYNTVKRW